MVLWRLNMLLQCVILGLSCTGGYQDCFFWLRCEYRDPFRPPSLISTGGSAQNVDSLHPHTPKPSSAPHTLLIILDALQPLAGRLCVCGRACACVSVFLWLCWRPCSGCGATAAMDPTRCVLSATPAPPPGPGSASNPEATSAAICRQIAQTD